MTKKAYLRAGANHMIPFRAYPLITMSTPENTFQRIPTHIANWLGPQHIIAYSYLQICRDVYFIDAAAYPVFKAAGFFWRPAENFNQWCLSGDRISHLKKGLVDFFLAQKRLRTDGATGADKRFHLKFIDSQIACHMITRNQLVSVITRKRKTKDNFESEARRDPYSLEHSIERTGGTSYSSIGSFFRSIQRNLHGSNTRLFQQPGDGRVHKCSASVNPGLYSKAGAASSNFQHRVQAQQRLTPRHADCFYIINGFIPVRSPLIQFPDEQPPIKVGPRVRAITVHTMKTALIASICNLKFNRYAFFQRSTLLSLFFIMSDFQFIFKDLT